MPYTRKGYAGGAEQLQTQATINVGDLSFISSATPSANWPTGAGSKPFVIRVGAGTANEEKMLAGSRSGATFSSLTRGYDGTTATTHNAGEFIEHDWDATSADEANQAVVQTLGQLTAAGQILISSSTSTFGAITAPAGANLPLVSTGVSGAGWSQLVGAGIANATITATQIAPATITATQIANTTITAAQIANATITDVQVAAANKDGTAGTASMRTLGAGAGQATAGNATVGGDLTGTLPNPTLAAAGPGATGPLGTALRVPVVTIDAKGRVTALTDVAIAAATLGTLGYAQIVVAQNGITSSTDIVGLATTVTVGAGRRIKVTGYVTVKQNTNISTVALAISEGATTLQIANAALNVGWQHFVTATAILTPSTGSHTYKLVIGTVFGTVDVQAASTSPAFILVEDIGT